MEDVRQTTIVSFDFDGVLHTDMVPGTNDPVQFDSPILTPRHEYHDLLRQEAETHTIVVVTARSTHHEPVVWSFLKKHNLPVTEVYCTNLRPKGDILQRLGVIRHYDDSPRVVADLTSRNIEVVQVPMVYDTDFFEECIGGSR